MVSYSYINRDYFNEETATYPGARDGTSDGNHGTLGDVNRGAHKD